MRTQAEEPSTAQDQRSGLPPWLLLVLPGLLLSFLSLRVVAPVTDPDTYWHIASGDHLRRTWDFVLDDPFGAAAEKPWILNQWLPQLAMSVADEVAGLPGVVWLTVLGTLAVMATYYVACRRRSSALVATLIVAVAFLATSGSIAPRPQLVTFALTAVVTDAWLRTTVDHKPRWWLMPLTWLWACSHGMWFMGIVVGGATLLGLAASRRVDLRAAFRLALIPLASLVAAAVTPVGPVLLTSPFQVSGVTAYITEWQPPSANDPAFLAALGLILIVVVDAARNRQGRASYVVLLTVLAFVLAVAYARTAGVAAAIVAPLSAAGLTRLARQPAPTVSHRENQVTAGFGIVALAVAAVMVPTVAARPGLGANELDAEIAALPVGTVVCNDWLDGGWLIWKHPNVRVTMDSRVEIYSVDHIRGYSAFVNAGKGWEAYLAENSCTVALLRTDSAIAHVLVAHAGEGGATTRGGHVLLRGLGD
ncbi:hypothetical protein [Intrasporangium sp. DVR]|uniref:hypothetical protein n=1 Tax=Intrasporangium sp. DVR TaxID=3127867 RepID=UPI00313A68F3